MKFIPHHYRLQRWNKHLSNRHMNLQCQGVKRSANAAAAKAASPRMKSAAISQLSGHNRRSKSVAQTHQLCRLKNELTSMPKTRMKGQFLDEPVLITRETEYRKAVVFPRQTVGRPRTATKVMAWTYDGQRELERPQSHAPTVSRDTEMSAAHACAQKFSAIILVLLRT